MKRTLMAITAGCLFGAYTGMADEAKTPVSWTDTVEIKGDMRYRFEYIDDAAKDTSQQRDRISLHLGAYGKANEWTDVGIRLSTTQTDSPGNGDPISGNQTVGSSGSRKDAYIDLGYIDLHPDELEGVDIVFGKMKNPYISTGQIIWDNDYNPEGVALKYKAGDEVELIAAAGYAWLDERSSTSDDGKQYGAQAALKFHLDKQTYVLVGGSYFMTDNIKDGGLLDNQGKNRSFGNSTKQVVSGGSTNTVYANDYNVAEGFFEAGCDIGMPAKIYGAYVVNTDASSDDTAYVAGVTLGKAKETGSFEFGYDYRDVEKDAVLAAITYSDPAGGGTNYKGHEVYVKYKLAKNLTLAATYMKDKKDPDGKDTDYDRLQLDIVAAF